MVRALPAARALPAVSMSLRLRGGATDVESADTLRDVRRRRAGMGSDEGDTNDLEAATKRRAEQARRAGSHAGDSVSKTLYRVFASASNKLGITVRVHTIARLLLYQYRGHVARFAKPHRRAHLRARQSAPVFVVRKRGGLFFVTRRVFVWAGVFD